jgi:hypothetical protein
MPVLSLDLPQNWPGLRFHSVRPEGWTSADAHFFPVMGWLRMSFSVKTDIDEINADDMIGVFIHTPNRLQLGGFAGALGNAGFPVIGGPSIFGEKHRMAFKQMVRRDYLEFRLLHHDLLQQSFGSRALPAQGPVVFSIENNFQSGGFSEFCFQKRTQVINLSSESAAN